MKGLAVAGQVDLRTETPGDQRVRGDEGLLHQMIVNLVENAIRHTPAGGAVRVTLTADQDQVVLKVDDTGQGIAEADRDRVFERFVRAANPANSVGEANKHHTPGTGLGLAIARRIARVHGGDVRLMSTGPSGTCFAATLPYPAADADISSCRRSRST